MAANKPVLVSDVVPMKRIVEEENCGLVYEERSIEGFISQLLRLQNAEFRNKLGQNGAKAVKERYNWGNDFAVMINSIKMVLKQ